MRSLHRSCEFCTGEVDAVAMINDTLINRGLRCAHVPQHRQVLRFYLTPVMTAVFFEETEVATAGRVCATIAFALKMELTNIRHGVTKRSCFGVGS